jgi:hypothetical protein
MKQGVDYVDSHFNLCFDASTGIPWTSYTKVFVQELC